MLNELGLETGQDPMPRLPLFQAGLILAHEFEHVEHRHDVYPPSPIDPQTNGEPCGACAHAQMHTGGLDCIEMYVGGLTDDEVGEMSEDEKADILTACLLYTSPSPRDQRGSRMPSSA